MIYAGIYPCDSADLPLLQSAIAKLRLNDSSVDVSPDSSDLLGSGFTCSFLGLLHMDVFIQRLRDEFEVSVIACAPTVPYTYVLKSGEKVTIKSPSEVPDPITVREVLEPMACVDIVTPAKHLGAIMVEIFRPRRADKTHLEYLDEETVSATYLVPWQDVVSDLSDEIKAKTSGYGSMVYTNAPARASDIVKVDILLNGTANGALSFLAHRSAAQSRGRAVAERLKATIRRQEYEVIIQAAIGRKVVARARVKPFRKDVLNKNSKKVTGVDRKRKLLDKQKKVKKGVEGEGSRRRRSFH